ncbi:MAG: type II toxin-antitoxin system HicB family antitoxin [Candidatus Uhrbacteria bacterium]
MSTRKTIKKTVGQFPVVVQADELGGYWVNCPMLEGCYSQGETIDEALENIREAIALCLEDFPQKKKKPVRREVSLHFVQV